MLPAKIFPDQMEDGKIIPILKPGNDPTAPPSNKPITLLSAVSKVFERIIHQRPMEYVEEYQVLVPEQFSFRKGYSTVH